MSGEWRKTQIRHILLAARSLRELDASQVLAVKARIELDLRIGSAFTRFLTLLLQSLPELSNTVVSYGNHLYSGSATNICRVLSVSHTWFCS